MASDLTFEVPVQKIIFRNFLQFVSLLGLPIEVSFANNRAYFNIQGQNIALSVFPYRNEGIHFEFSRDLNKPFNTNNTIPVYVNTREELEIIKPAVKVLFITKSVVSSSPEPKKIVPVAPSVPPINTGPVIQRSRPSSEGTAKSPRLNRVINKFFE